MSNNKDFKVKNGIQPTVYQEGVGTVVSASVGYAVSSGKYDSKSFVTTSQETAPHGISIKPDGTKLFVLGKIGNDVGEYTLSTAYDISTASFVDSFSTATQLSNPRGLFFKPDGTKFYAVGTTTDKVFQYSMTTAWDVSTASYESKEVSVSSQETSPYGLSFKTDGTKMYILGNTGGSVFQYALSTAWDISTASYDSVSYSVSSLGAFPLSVVFNDTGTEMYTTSSGNSQFVRVHTLTTAWDVSTASHTGSLDTSVDITAGAINGISFANSGQKMYFSQQGPDTIYQYSTVLTTNTLDLSSGSVFKITPTSDIQVQLSNPAASGTSSGATLLLDHAGYGGYDLGNASYDSVSFSIAAQDANPVSAFFNNNGTKLYMLGGTYDSAFQYSLSTAYNVNTASYDNVSFSFASQDTNPQSALFNNDGTKLYMVGTTNDSVFQYSLSTAFDLSTASYDSVSFSVAAQDANPYGITFNNDGTKLYMVGISSDYVYQYALSTAFDISTSSYTSVSFSVASQDTVPSDVFFNNGGTKMYVFGSTNDSVHQYSLSTAFDLSTTSYDSVSFSVSSQDTNPKNALFNNDGTKLYMLGATNDSVFQYSTSTPSTITYPSTLKWPSGTAPTSPAIGETDVITFNTTDGGTTYKSALAIDGAK